MSKDNIYTLERDVRDEIREMPNNYGVLLSDLIGSDETQDYIHEIVDGWVPIYQADIIACAASCIELAIIEPELGPAFDGTATPTNIIAANIYERLLEVANDEWSIMEDEGVEE